MISYTFNHVLSTIFHFEMGTCFKCKGITKGNVYGDEVILWLPSDSSSNIPFSFKWFRPLLVEGQQNSSTRFPFSQKKPFSQNDPPTSQEFPRLPRLTKYIWKFWVLIWFNMIIWNIMITYYTKNMLTFLVTYTEHLDVWSLQLEKAIMVTAIML